MCFKTRIAFGEHVDRKGSFLHPSCVCVLTDIAGHSLCRCPWHPACVLIPCAPRSCWATLLRTPRTLLLQSLLCPCRLLSFPLLCQILCCLLSLSSCLSSPAPWPLQWSQPLRVCPHRPLYYSRQQTHLCPLGLQSLAPALLSS